MLLKLFCCIPLSYCLSEWKYLSKNSESELVENFFRSQLRIHLQETPVELYLQELLNSKNVIELIRALECLPSEKIDTKFLENLKNHSNEEVIKSVNRHLVYYKQDDLNQRMSLASLKMEQGDVNQAHWILEELLNEASGDARYVYLFAQTKRELNDIGNARKLLQKSLQINSSQLDVRKSLARVELDAGNIRQGLSLILECLEKNNHDASLRLWLFEAYGKLKELKQAYTSFFDIPKAILKPKHWELFVKFCFKLKKYRTVIENFELFRQELGEELPSYHSQTYLAISYYLTKNQSNFDKEIEHLKSRYEDEISQLKA